MSKHELIDAYISHRINRRAFIQGLTALGVSSGVAASYAVALQPVSAAECDPNGYYRFYDFYGFYEYYEYYDMFCEGSGGDPGGGNPVSQPDGSQGGSGPTGDGQSEDDGHKKKRRRRKGKNKKKKH